MAGEGGGLAAAFEDYGRRWPGEGEVVGHFLALLAEPADPSSPDPASTDPASTDPASTDPFLRERIAGHFTASSWLVAADGARTLLTHHRKLGLWLQLGGHADGDRDLARAALREAEEESGLQGLSIEPGIFDLDRHWIPDHKGVPAHWHYDVRFVVRAGTDESFVVSDESHALAWRDIAALARDDAADASVRRMARKWLER